MAPGSPILGTFLSPKGSKLDSKVRSKRPAGQLGCHNQNIHAHSTHMNCYPILGCDIQGFQAIGLSVQY